MKKILLFAILIFYSLVNIAQESNIDSLKKTLVYKFDIKKEIGPAMWRLTKKAMNEADSLKADYILIHMNTYGGLVNDADSIRTRILNSKITTLVFIDNNAASAGALISIACDSIYMRKGANIGAATVVNQTGQAMPDKYQSYMRSTMRSTAEAQGMDSIFSKTDTIVKWRRNPIIAEAMVDPRTYIENIIDTGKVLTFTANEALKHSYCEGIVENIDELLELAKIRNYEIKEYETSTIDNIISMLINPMFQGFLMMIIFGGIYFELQSPGVGFPIAAACIAAILYFSPLYIEGLAANWEIILFIVGLLLIALEVFVIPGFGIAGISGSLLVLAGLSLSMVDNVDLRLNEKQILHLLQALFLILFSIIASIVVSYFLFKKMLQSSSFTKISLNTELKTEEGCVSIDLNMFNLVGSEAICFTDLRPSGKILINDNVYDAISEYSFIAKDTKVIVTRCETGQLYVMKI